MQAPVLLCGLGKVGWRVLEFLRTAGHPVVAIDRLADPADPRLFGVRLVRGDFREKATLTEAGIREARGVLIVSSDDLANISAALMVRSLNAEVRIVLRMFNHNLVTRLGKAVRNVAALSVSALAAPLLALTALTGEVLAAFPAGDAPRQIIDVQIRQGSRLAGRTVAELNADLRYQVLAHTPFAHQPRLLHEMDPSARLEPGDSVIVCSNPEDVPRLLEPGKDPLEVFWAGKLRRYGRLLARTISEMDLAVKICSLTLLTVIAFSMCIYHYALHVAWADALYRTISVIATGADLGGHNYEGWGKVFVSFLRLMGTALVAAFTAIVTNYLLTARMGGIFEMRRVPDRGHVVVCGLGNVGFRVVEELVRLDERVVVIEARADNPFIISCRRQGVAVIIGDATVPEALRQARVPTARAVVAATSADLVNLEIALLVADLNPEQRVVVRLGDNVLAETVRRAASVKLALSVAELAAPAFIARLLGDRVHGMFLIGGKLLAILELRVTARDERFTGKPLRQVAAEHRFLPIVILNSDKKAIDLNPDRHMLTGEAILAVAAVEDMEHILRHDGASKA